MAAIASKTNEVVRAGTGVYYDRGELFSYLSPGCAAGEISGGAFGSVQTELCQPAALAL